MKPYKNIAKKEHGVLYPGDKCGSEIFEENYLDVRKKEGRLLSDEFVRMLPHLPESHPLHKEWLHRAATLNRFYTYLSSLKKASTVLDLGCGNGWFCVKLKSVIPQANLYGLDVNKAELIQAAKLFSNDQIVFLHGDIFEDIFETGSFDIIILNSSIQYFPDVKILLNRLLELLSNNGEIHILDSPFYSSGKQQKEAKIRSHDYFTSMGVEGMTEYYHHHTYNSLRDFSFRILYNPKSIRNSLIKISGKKINPFPWIRVTKS